jgi:N utilization substance protein B
VRRPETKARARALQLLYAWEQSGRHDLRVVASRVAGLCERSAGRQDRVLALAERAVANLAAYDRLVARVAEHWRLERLGLVERNILRLALAELDEGRTPAKVIIDEAVGLAHWFAGERAPSFINGVLDRLARERGAL